MHHPPFNIGIPYLDRISLREDAQRIQQIVGNFSNIKHLFFGHVHRPVSGSWHGIPFTTLRGTNHQVQLDLSRGLFTHQPWASCLLRDLSGTATDDCTFPWLHGQFHVCEKTFNHEMNKIQIRNPIRCICNLPSDSIGLNPWVMVLGLLCSVCC